MPRFEASNDKSRVVVDARSSFRKAPAQETSEQHPSGLTSDRSRLANELAAIGLYGSNFGIGIGEINGE